MLGAPVLTAAIKNKTEAYVVDCTFGGGGHTAAFLEGLQSMGAAHIQVLGIDQDQSALERGETRFKDEIKTGRLVLKHGRFSQWTEFADSKPVVGLLSDLGFSSDQIDTPERGLSFLRDGPLDMRLDPSQGYSLLDILRRARETEIAKWIFEYAEERYSRQIARAIVNARSDGKLPTTTLGLADLISHSVPPAYRFGRIHPATRTFQAFRIHVNDELGELDALLQSLSTGLSVHGRAAILSFHSLEDRKVKQSFRDKLVWQSLSKKPIEADEVEVGTNPRARSAKLRVVERIG